MDCIMSSILKSVEAFNFRSWKHLKFRFDKKGSVIVYGSTGAGKSSIFDAIYWTLYGELPESTSADEVCHFGGDASSTNTVGNTASIIRWSTDSVAYKLARYRK